MRTDPITRARSREEVPLASRDRADGARAADRRGAARGRRAPGSAGLATGSRRKPAPISTRSASRSTTRPPSPRWPPSCCAISSWSRASRSADADPDEGDEGEGDDEDEGGDDDEQDEDDERRPTARPRSAVEQDERGEERGRERLVRGGARPRPPTGSARRARRACCRSAPTGPSPICRRSFDYKHLHHPASTRWSRRPSCATRRSWAGCAPISTSSSSISRARSPSSPTGCSAG